MKSDRGRGYLNASGKQVSNRNGFNGPRGAQGPGEYTCPSRQAAALQLRTTGQAGNAGLIGLDLIFLKELEI